MRERILAPASKKRLHQQFSINLGLFPGSDLGRSDSNWRSLKGKETLNAFKKPVQSSSYTFLYDFHTFTYGLHPIFHRTYTFDQNSIVASQFFPELQK